MLRAKFKLTHYRIAWLLIFALAAAVRFYHLGKNSFWQDEMLSLKNSSGQLTLLGSLPTNTLARDLPHLTRLDRSTPWWRLWGPVDCDIHPPLYYILLHLWRDVFGDSEFAVRSLSVIASLAGLVFFYNALRLQGSPATALWGTALLAVAFPQIHASQNARDYTLWMALALGGAYALLLIEHRGFSWRRGVGLGVCALAMLLSHYFAAFSVLSLALYTLLALRGRNRLAAIGVLIAATMIYLIVWGAQLLHQDHAGVSWLADYSRHPHLQTLARIIQLPLQSLSAAGNNLLAAALFFTALCIGLIYARADRRVLFWIIWLTPLCACVVAIDWINHLRMLDVSRYTFVGTTAFCALVPLLSQRVLRHRWGMATGAIFLLGLLSVPWSYRLPTEWRDLAELFRAGVVKGDVMVYTGGNWNSWESFVLFLGIDHYAPDLPADVVLLTDVHAPVTKLLPPTGKSVWMICYEPDLAPQAIFPNGRIVQQMVLPNVGRVAQIVRR